MERGKRDHFPLIFPPPSGYTLLVVPAAVDV